MIGFTETWCDESGNKNSLLKSPNYVLVHQTRNERKEGGLFFIHKTLNFNLRKDMDHFDDTIQSLSKF